MFFRPGLYYAQSFLIICLVKNSCKYPLNSKCSERLILCCGWVVFIFPWHSLVLWVKGLKMLVWKTLLVKSTLFGMHCTENHIFFFQTSWKDGISKKKKCAGIWSFLYYRERWYFFFPKIWSYTLDGKWKMIFLKKYKEIWYFLQTLKRWSFQKGPRRHMIFLVLSGKMVFFDENMIFFPWAESERRSFSGNTWKHDALPSEEKQETWYIGSKLGLSLNLFGWRYSTKNNL